MVRTFKSIEFSMSYVPLLFSIDNVITTPTVFVKMKWNLILLLDPDVQACLKDISSFSRIIYLFNLKYEGVSVTWSALLLLPYSVFVR